MKRISVGLAIIAALGLLTFCPAVMAQTITFPQTGQQVRGTIKVTFDGVPDGGYCMLYLDGTAMQNLLTATSQPSYLLDTFHLSEGEHTLSIIVFNAGNKRAGNSDVTFQVANSTIDQSAEGVRLKVWTLHDRLSDVVRRYRVFAESNASVEGGSSSMGGAGGGGGAAGGMGSMGGGSQSDQPTWIPAPLDWQLNLLIRSVVRDVGMVDGAANIRSIVQEGYQRQRLSEEGKGGAGGAGGPPGATTTRRHKKIKANPGGPTKAPWGTWVASPETGRYFVKTVKSNGDEINATRKAATLAVGDLLPRFPEGVVRPGFTWDTDMSVVGEIPISIGVNVRVPMTFVSFEDVQTPAGVSRRCAKLESVFNLPLEAATRIARSIQKEVGSGKGAGGAGAQTVGQATSGVGGPGGAGASEDDAPDFTSVSTTIRRETWFDVKGNQVLRSTDTVDTAYEEEADTQAGAMGPGGSTTDAAAGDSAGASAQSTPNKVSYNLRITRYLDDTVPPPSGSYNGGSGTAHAHENVHDPTIELALGSR